jgi:2,3,4,5-tetrahydropyridine-2-carboxylate N-succinyltransferase
MEKIKALIETAFELRTTLTPETVDTELKNALEQIFALLDAGTLRLAEKTSGQWHTSEWLKKAILLAFRVFDNQIIDAGFTRFYDKLPLKFCQQTSSEFQKSGIRVAPTAIVRRGAYIGPNTILMPSYVNIGAFIDSGCMIDTWATVGSCAQIGKNVHLSGGVGIGGVLEPLQINPTIIEDNCFIGARSEIVEGVIVEEGSVISMGVYIGQSTRIYNRLTNKITYGRIPAGSVVVPGSLPSSDGQYSLYCAVIVKTVDAATRTKTSINELLRNII